MAPGFIGLVLGLVLGAVGLTGCGTPGAPQPPSLKLPRPVEDLTAVRAGETVTLRWTSPKKTTDHIPIKGSIPVRICWRETTGSCVRAGEATAVPGVEGEFRATLPAELASGKPREVDYFIELESPRGRAAGPSNPAQILAGAAPPAVTGLSAEVRADGVALHWHGLDKTPVRLHRRLLQDATVAAAGPKRPGGSKTSLTAPAPEPVERDLLVDQASGAAIDGALDASARFGARYEYSAQRVERVSLGRVEAGGAEAGGAEAGGAQAGKMLELPGETSAPLPVDVVDIFPPAVPQGLVAVAVAEEKTIDLSWQPDTEADLAGYIVYRIGSGEASDGSGASDWMRISGPQPVAEAAYRDRAVEPGHTYQYAVSAIDATGHESKRSAEARESLPNP